MAIRRRVRSATHWPLSSAAPNSVTITSTSLRAVVTGPDSAGAILDSAPPFAVAESAMIARPPGERAPAHEIDLPARAPEISGACLLGVDLAGKIDLERRIDRNQSRQARHHAGVVRVAGGAHAHRRIAVGPVVKPARADQRAVDRDAAIDLLPRVRDDAGFDEIDEPVAHHSRVNAQILAIGEQA